MTPPADRLVVVTAGASAERLEHFADVLRLNAADPQRVPPVVAVLQKDQRAARVYRGLVDRHADYLGVVPAFARGVELALTAYPAAEIIACLHDDVDVRQPDWDQRVVELFDRQPACGLAGFGGAWGLGDVDAGQGKYRPTWLVRRGFMSNMDEAEVHGTRVTEARRIAVLDGFSLVFRRAFLHGWKRDAATELGGTLRTIADAPDFLPAVKPRVNLFQRLTHWGVVHHAYDAAMGAFARELGWETWLLPLECRHHGGQTAVGDARYTEWARGQRPGGAVIMDEVHLPTGDQAFWEEAHRIIWQKLGHLLPFEVDRP